MSITNINNIRVIKTTKLIKIMSTGHYYKFDTRISLRDLLLTDASRPTFALAINCSAVFRFRWLSSSCLDSSSNFRFCWNRQEYNLFKFAKRKKLQSTWDVPSLNTWCSNDY